MSTSTTNPYQAPQAALSHVPLTQGSIVRDGQFLRIAREGVVLPPRCVKCNEPADSKGPLRRIIYWHSPGWYLLVLFPGLLFYALIALIVRKKAVVQVALCEQHRGWRRTAITMAWLGSIAALTGIFGIVEFVPGAVMPGVPLLLLFALVTLLVGIVGARDVTARRMDKESAWLKVGRPFLESF